MASNNETVEDIMREMRSLEFDDPRLDIYGLMAVRTLARGWADRIEDAHKRERDRTGVEATQICDENYNRSGNAAKMRNALEEISREIWESIDPFCDDDCCKPKRELAKIADAALAATPRNCDRPECATTKAAQEVWRKEDGGKTAYYEWLLETSTKGETK